MASVGESPLPGMIPTTRKLATTVMSSIGSDPRQHINPLDNLNVSLNLDHLLFVIDIVIMLSSIVGNVFVIYFICGQKKARTTPNITVVSISVADILVAAFVMPTYFAVSKYNAAEDTLTPFLCKLNAYVWYWCKTVTIYSIVALVCDRNTRVTRPYKTHIQSGRYMFFLSFVWFFGAAYNIWEIVIKTSSHVNIDLRHDVLYESVNVSAVSALRNHTYHEPQNASVRRCMASTKFRYLQNGFVVVDLIVIFLLPMLIGLCLYGNMLCFVYRGSYSVNFHAARGHCQSPSHVVGRRRIVISAILFSLYYLCQIPVELLDIIIYYSEIPVTIGLISAVKISETVSFAQGLFNIIAYGSCSVELHSMLRKWCVERGNGRVVALGGMSRTPALQVTMATPSTENGAVTEMTVLNGASR